MGENVPESSSNRGVLAGLVVGIFAGLGALALGLYYGVALTPRRLLVLLAGMVLIFASRQLIDRLRGREK